MSIEDWQHGTPPDSVANQLEPSADRVGLVGAHHFKFIASVRVFLSGWSVGGRVDSGIEAIPFDKLANLAARTWVAAKAISQAPDFTPMPFEEIRGVHGPGQALVHHKEEGPRYVLEVLHRLQQLLPERAPFEVDAHVVNGDPIANHYLTRIRLPLPRLDNDPYLEALGIQGAEWAEGIAEQLAPLDVNELRAVGTHNNAHTLLRSLEYHQDRLRDRRAVLLDALRNKKAIPKNVPGDMATSCSELKRKTLDNEDHYERARLTIRDGLPELALSRVSFDTVHKPAAEIWCPDGLADWRSRLAPICALIGASNAYTEFLSTRRRSSKLEERLQRQLDEALADIPDHGLPRHVGDCVDADGGMVSSLIDRLEELFNRFGI